MSEVVIELELKRRSGVLAAAIAALGRAGLQFVSQRLAADDGEHRLFLKAEAEGVACDAIVRAFAEVPAVVAVADVSRDGVSLLNPPRESEPLADSPPAAADPDAEPETRDADGQRQDDEDPKEVVRQLLASSGSLTLDSELERGPALGDVGFGSDGDTDTDTDIDSEEAGAQLSGQGVADQRADSGASEGPPGRPRRRRRRR